MQTENARLTARLSLEGVARGRVWRQTRDRGKQFLCPMGKHFHFCRWTARQKPVNVP